MVIRFQHANKWIQILGEDIIPTQIKFKFIRELLLKFDIEYKSSLITEEDLKIKQIPYTELKDYILFYKDCKCKCSLEEFVKCLNFPFSNLNISTRNQSEVIAAIDFEPDGDLDKIWIDLFNINYLQILLDTIKVVLDDAKTIL